jgi:hypothetical protein
MEIGTSIRKTARSLPAGFVLSIIVIVIEELIDGLK